MKAVELTFNLSFCKIKVISGIIDGGTAHMKKIIFNIEYLSNVYHKNLAVISVESESLNWNALLLQIKEVIEPILTSEFNQNKLFFDLDGQLTPFDAYTINQHAGNDGAAIYYLDIVSLNNAKHLPVNCKSKNGGDIVFDIFPKEQPHRFLPHTMASCGGQTIRIAFKDTVTILGKQHFTGNNAPNEQIAIRFVESNKDYFIAEWDRIVESQFH